MDVPGHCGVCGCTKCQPGQKHYCRVCKQVDVDHLSWQCPTKAGTKKRKGGGKLKAAVAQARGDVKPDVEPGVKPDLQKKKNDSAAVVDLTDEEQPRKKACLTTSKQTTPPMSRNAQLQTKPTSKHASPSITKISPTRSPKPTEPRAAPLPSAYLFDSSKRSPMDPVLASLPVLPQDRRQAAEQIAREAKQLDLIKMKTLNDRDARIKAGTFLQAACFDHAETLIALGYKIKGSSTSGGSSNGGAKAIDVDADEDEGPNAELFKQLTELADFAFKNGDRFKGANLKKAAASVKEQKAKIVSGKAAEKLKGIGKSTAKKIDEYLRDGVITQLQEIRMG